MQASQETRARVDTTITVEMNYFEARDLVIALKRLTHGGLIDALINCLEPTIYAAREEADAKRQALIQARIPQ